MSLAGTATRERQLVLGGVLGGLLLLSMVVLFEVLGTIVFAMTVAFILSPAKRHLRRRGVGQLTATLAVTTGAVVGLLALLAPPIVLLVLRMDQIIGLVLQLPATVSIGLGGMELEFALVELRRFLTGWVRSTAVEMSALVPVLLVKLALFAFLVFALVYNERGIADSVFSVVPPRHRDIARAMDRRARDTLFAIYVLQGVTALATVIISMPVFYVLGYDSWLPLATVAGVLQFVPVIGPSLLIIVLAIGEVLIGNTVDALLVVAVGGILIAAAPDLVVRPRIASYTIRLSSTLYFIGFVGGMLTIGALGIIIGPLLVALVVEAARLLADGFEPEPPIEPSRPAEEAHN